MFTPKGLVRGAFESADLPRLPFIPWIFTHAARLEQIPIQKIYAEPTQYTKCLQNARKLYGYDAIISSFDASLEAEICGCPIDWGGVYETPTIRPNPEFNFGTLDQINLEDAAKTGRFGTVIECLRRMKMVVGSNLALAAVISGPLTLKAAVTGRDLVKDFAEKPEETIRTIEAASRFLLKIVQVDCQLELDVIVFTEKLVASCPTDQFSWLRSTLSPVVNTVRFFNAFSLLLSDETSPDSITRLLDLGFDGIVASGIDVNTWRDIRDGRPCILGKAIPGRLLNSNPGELRTYLETNLPESAETGVFLTTDWELPPETPTDNIHLVMSMINRPNA
jgi:uroporphyrinogen-III decarboxylase